MIENTITEFFAGSSDVWGSPADLLSHQDADPAFGLSVARGVAAAAMTLANWEPSSALPFGAATSAGMDGTNRSDSGEHRASTSLADESAWDGAAAQCDAENLVLQVTARAWSKDKKIPPHEGICHSSSFETFIPRCSTPIKEVTLELTIEGDGRFAIEGNLENLYANSRVEVWARSTKSLPLLDGTLTLLSGATEVSGSFSEDDFTLSETAVRTEAILSGWKKTILFDANLNLPFTLCGRISQIAYAQRGGGEAQCTWTEPLQLSVGTVTPDVWLEVAGFAEAPQVSLISADGGRLTLTWQPFWERAPTIEQSDDLISWTPVATTPFSTWKTEDWAGKIGFFRVRSEYGARGHLARAPMKARPSDGRASSQM